jgi:hypothetical protein
VYNDNKRGRKRLKTNTDFLDSHWFYSSDNVFKQLLTTRKSAFITDISSGGVGFLSANPIKEGSQISVTVAYKTYRPFFLNVRVRSCKAIENPIKSNQSSGLANTPCYYRVSCQFLYNSSESSSELERLLSRLEKQMSETA